MDEMTKEQMEDTLLHKRYVMESAGQMAEWLRKNGQSELADELLQRAVVHDDSKLDGREAACLASLPSRQQAMSDPNYLPGCEERQILQIHWTHNRHHPEHFSRVEDMEELDVVEMVCDWAARSWQYGTDLIPFVCIRQENRFHFPDAMFERILHYCQAVKSPDPFRIQYVRESRRAQPVQTKPLV